MSAIPLHDLDEVATKGYVATRVAELRADVADSRLGLETRMSGLEARIETRMSELEAKLETGITGLRAEVTAEIGAFRKTMTHWMLTLLVAIIGAMAGIGFMT